MIILDSTSRSLEILLGGVVATNELPIVSSFVEVTATTFVPLTQLAISSGVTPVTIVASPATLTQRQVKFITIRNEDTASVVLTLRYKDAATIRELVKVTLDVDDVLIYTDGEGFRVLDSSGAVKSGAGGGGLTLTTKGDLHTFDTADVALPVGTDGQVLTADSALAKGIKWATPSGGKLVQFSFFEDGEVATGTGTIPIDDTIPQITEGFEIMTLTHTPANAANTLMLWVGAFTENPSQSRMTVAVFKDAVADALGVANERGDNGDQHFINFGVLITAGTTSPITFRVRVGADAAGTTTFNGAGGSRLFGGALASSISVFEVEP